MFALRTVRWVTAMLVTGTLLLPSCKREPEESGRPAGRSITVWSHQGREAENAAMRSIVEAFNDAHKEDGQRIRIEFFPDRQYADKVAIASAARQLPDVLDIDGPLVAPWAAEELLLPIDDLVDKRTRRDFLPTIIQQGTYKEKLYALGAYDSALVVFYNRDVIERADLEPPEQASDAWTWEQFVEALMKVKGYSTIPLSLHMDEQSDEWLLYAFSPLVWSNRGRLIDGPRNRAVGELNSSRCVEAMTRWQELFETGLAEPTSTNPNPFAAGLAAFDWTGHWMLPSFNEAEGLRFGVMPLPRMGDRPVVTSGSWCWGISRSCTDRELAWKVIEWFVDPEHGIAPMVKANGAVPGRRSAFRLFPEYEEMPYRLFREQLETIGRPRPRTPVYPTLSNEFARALRDIALGADVKKSLTLAAENVQRALDRTGELGRNAVRLGNQHAGKGQS